MRKLDGKFVIDGDKILNPAGVEIPENEPLFLLRARDYLAMTALLAYRAASTADGCNDYHMDGVNGAIKRFAEFARRNPDRMKQPGVTRGR